MLQVQNAIEQHAALLKRDAAVRLRLWLTKLAEQVSWRENREVLQCGVIFLEKP